MSYCIFNYLFLAESPAALEHRFVRRPATAAFAALLNSLGWSAAMGAGGIYSTALEMAIFAQAFLNGGSYGDKRILSPAAVEAMTRNQIPGISAGWYGEWHN